MKMRGQVKDLELRSLIARGLFGYLAVWLIIVAIAVSASYLVGAQ